MSIWVAAGAAALAAAVGLGAFGAHGLRSRLDAYSMGVYEKAVFYHFIHGLGLILVPLLVRAQLVNPAVSARVCWLLIAGILLFSGSLYVLAISGVRWLGAVTPFGGLAFILAWLMLVWAALRN